MTTEWVFLERSLNNKAEKLHFLLFSSCFICAKVSFVSVKCPFITILVQFSCHSTFHYLHICPPWNVCTYFDHAKQLVSFSVEILTATVFKGILTLCSLSIFFSFFARSSSFWGNKHEQTIFWTNHFLDGSSFGGNEHEQTIFWMVRFY